MRVGGLSPGRRELDAQLCAQRLDVLQQLVEAVQRSPGLFDRLLGPLQRRAIVGRHQRPAQRLARVAGDQVVHQHHIAQALGHLLRLHGHEAVVQPVAREHRDVVGAAGLGDLVLMVGEDQVVAAAVDVDGGAERLGDHGRALDMPAWPPGAPGAVPDRLAGLGGLPQHEIGGMLLVGRDLDPGAGDHVVKRPTRELAVIGEGLGIEQHMPLGGVGRIGQHQSFDGGDDRPDVSSGAGLQGGPEGAQHRHVGVIGVQVPVGDHRDRHAFFSGLQIDLVVHVRDVGGVEHRVLAVEVAQQPKQHVEGHHRPGVADMGVVVDGGSAHIHRHALGIGRLEQPLFPGHGVVEVQLVHGA